MQHNTQLNPELAKEVNVDLRPTKERIMDNFSYWASFLVAVFLLVHFLWGQA
ncbi:hypothetical protein [Mannheimia haemolytica]|uniref:hypothetical protein n=1 Tax=Mannheimia haemolytica TaxID=75985 RepID=UPI000B13AF96|nr:hypothetical protein [Mannheimia haemolytica]UQX62049.1 hypothetical protein M3709_07610 [Mannheimia haemolytica]